MNHPLFYALYRTPPLEVFKVILPDLLNCCSTSLREQWFPTICLYLEHHLIWLCSSDCQEKVIVWHQRILSYLQLVYAVSSFGVWRGVWSGFKRSSFSMMMANKMVRLGGQLEVERKRGGGLFEGIWPKRMCRGKKREAKDRLCRGNTVGERRSPFFGIPVGRCPPWFAKCFCVGIPSSPNCEAYSRVALLGKVAE